MRKLLFSYLRFWARRYLARAKPQIIGITGSVGKTSTKDAIFEVLRLKFGNQIRKSEGNLNNETGVPLAILGYKNSPANFFSWLWVLKSAPFKSLFGRKSQILVLEYAADKPGDIDYLLTIAQPKIAVVTSIGPAHLEAFKTVDRVFQEKVKLVNFLPQDGLAIVNLDDEKLKEIATTKENLPAGEAGIKTYAIDEKADVMAANITTEIKNYEGKTNFQVIFGKNKFLATIQTLGRRWNIYAALAGVAVGLIYKMNLAEIIEGLKNIRSEKHRLNVCKGKNGSTIIDDSYNANPISMKAALEILRDLPAKRKIAVLGDMRELGKITDEAHRLIGDYAKEVADEVISVGDLARKYGASQHFDDTNPAIDFLLREIRQGDIILVKASRALALDKIVEALRA